MCLPSLKQHVYSALNPKADAAMVTVEARLNVMQTVFLILQTLPESSNDLLCKSQQTFQTLFNRHFSVDMEVEYVSKDAQNLYWPLLKCMGYM